MAGAEEDAEATRATGRHDSVGQVGEGRRGGGGGEGIQEEGYVRFCECE